MVPIKPLEMDKIESVDLAAILQNEAPEDQEFVKISEQFASSLKMVGFVYLLNHGVAEDIINQAMEPSNQ